MVVCNTDTIRFTVNTEMPFTGRIFAKGMSKRPECARDFPDANATQAEFELSLSNCGMMRERKLSPAPGLMESLTIVVSFHYLFVTKVKYLFVKVHKMTGLAVNQIAAEPLPMGQTQSAECKYDVRVGRPDGPPASAAQVGDVLHHMWSCVGPSDLRILVKDCRVFDGESEEFLIVDSRGCAVDPVIVPDLTYSPTAHTAQVQSHAFKFADTNFLGFQCTVQLCSEINGDDSCAHLSPPACSVSGYDAGIVSRARSQVFGHRQRLGDNSLPIFRDEIDVSSPTLSVLDVGFQADSKRRRFVHDGSDGLSGGDVVNIEEVEGASEAVCLSLFAFISFLVTAVLAFIVLCTIVIVQCYQSIKYRKMDWWRVA
uniref:ZP domain-containing protein n=1 Tax=Plectus sambesii TaxID=2011161 RepID=A0A914WU03_9BILA